MIVVTEELAKAWQDALAGKIKDIDPFISVDGTSFVRYDKIRIHQDGDMAVTEFFWRGMPLVTLHTKCSFSDNEMLNLEGIEGKMECRYGPP